jgi:hypothetical protein
MNGTNKLYCIVIIMCTTAVRHSTSTQRCNRRRGFITAVTAGGVVDQGHILHQDSKDIDC